MKFCRLYIVTYVGPDIGGATNMLNKALVDVSPEELVRSSQLLRAQLPGKSAIYVVNLEVL